MQVESQTHPDHSSHDPESNGESLYRTKWLMAHNALHEIINDPKASPKDVWASYLKKLQSSEEVARKPA
jgi:hypothetical protein